MPGNLPNSVATIIKSPVAPWMQTCQNPPLLCDAGPRMAFEGRLRTELMTQLSRNTSGVVGIIVMHHPTAPTPREQ